MASRNLIVVLLALYLPRLDCRTRLPGTLIATESMGWAPPCKTPVSLLQLPLSATAYSSEWGSTFAHLRASECAGGISQDYRVRVRCLRIRGGISVKKMASLGTVKDMPEKMYEYLQEAIKGGLSEEHWTSDESARDALDEWYALVHCAWLDILLFTHHTCPSLNAEINSQDATRRLLACRQR
jgi:hypothetical protein